MFVDLPEDQLREYRSAQTDPADFDEFWARTLAESRSVEAPVTVALVDTGLVTVDVYDVTFPGFGGQPIKAWLRVPAGATGPLPTIVEFVGYGGGRGHAIEKLIWASAGFAHFHMDTRGQGSSWSVGDTPDEAGTGPQFPGFMTRGIADRESYYYRRLITDAVRAVDAARSLDLVDPSRVAVLGQSQGGGLALAVAGLVPDLSAVVSYVPFLCDFPRATTFTDNDPYREIGRYLAVRRSEAAAVRTTLAYFDGVNFAARAVAPAWISAALMDSTCPPSTVFGAYNNYAGPKQMTVWPYNDHEGGGIDSDEQSLAVLRGIFAEQPAAAASVVG
ncbi:acetylxylan esterase [Compostimonas suwonensis]|uniref:Cephalosporin-C deacetylase n=1 Tax=Compostimonas suwonensis TaxID=1048394 RepID=A0A2M9C3T6_9MICO|nr:acetylxylan esterase [Compostimonas suwonensis]PJJ65172.1 cephalosporin-C deacetylase [Compostimonas suwonensis]